jgi:hypothetical protein
MSVASLSHSVFPVWGVHANPPHRPGLRRTRFDPIFTPMGPVRDGPRGAENFKNRLEKRAENRVETGAKGVEKRAARLGRLRGDGGRD